MAQPRLPPGMPTEQAASARISGNDARQPGNSPFNGVTRMTQPAFCRPAAHEAFARALEQADSTPGLILAAATIALHEKPEADVDGVLPAIDRMRAAIRARVQSEASQAKLAHLHDLLFDVMGIRGNSDDYYSSANSYLPDVLRTRRGIPISLVLVYKGVAEGLGLTVHGINAPGHFLAAVELPSRTGTAGDWMYVDPFYGGGLLTRDEAYGRIAEATGRAAIAVPDLLIPATHHQWLRRMLNNLQVVFAATSRDRDVYAMQELEQLLTAGAEGRP